MPLHKHIVIVAGEESGDAHAAVLIHQLKAKHPKLYITGIGGKHMQAAGVELIADLAKFGVTGFSEVLKHFFKIKAAYRKIQRHLVNNKPDLLILVDFPGFNLRLAKFAKKILDIRIIYYISPQIWAWKAKRINTIKNCIDHMAVILPFEKKLYENAKVPVSFVGHPLLLAQGLQSFDTTEKLREKLSLPVDKRIVALLPGSRTHEIERLLPILVGAARILVNKIKDLHFVIPIASTINIDKITYYTKSSNLPISFVKGQALDVIACSNVVAVASGTASLECALLQKPMCIIYKTSLFTYICATQLIRIKYLGLCNLLANAMIVPELLQDDCTPEALADCLYALLTDNILCKNMIDRLAVLKSKLSSDVADCSLTDLIDRELTSSF